MIVATSGDQRRTFPHAEAFATWLRTAAPAEVVRVTHMQIVPDERDSHAQRHAR